MRTLLSAAAAGLCVLFLASSTCYAETIYGCTDMRSGVLRIVSPRGSRCRLGERRISWNSEGPQGAQGVQGEPGKPGTPGGPAVSAYAGNDEYLGLLLGHPASNDRLTIYVPSLSKLVSIGEKEGDIIGTMPVYYSGENCTGTMYFETNASVVPCGTNAYCTGDDQPQVINPLSCSRNIAPTGYDCYSWPAPCGAQNGRYYIGKPVTLPFSVPVALPIKLDTLLAVPSFRVVGVTTELFVQDNRADKVRACYSKYPGGRIATSKEYLAWVNPPVMTGYGWVDATPPYAGGFDAAGVSFGGDVIETGKETLNVYFPSGSMGLWSFGPAPVLCSAPE